MENVMIHGILSNRCPGYLAHTSPGMLTHLMKWIQEFLDHIGSYGVRSHMAYRSVTQWQGKEMRNLLRVLLAVFTAALTRRSDVPAIETRHRASCHKAILCVRYLTDFILIAQYK
ncbi:hypothetical protein BGX38DRAFT_1233267, partial [Terfezia claveryi]